MLAWVLFSALCGILIGPRAAADPVPGTTRQKSAGQAVRLTIVAPEQFHPALGEFVQHKKRLLSTELVSLEQVLQNSPGVDDPERLKRFLYERWRNRGLRYALLVGDIDVMPVRYMVLDRVTPAAFDYAFCPSDLYYADLAKRDGCFEDWNGNKESFHKGYFGEVRGEKNKKGPINFDRVDYLPEIAVGRWPVSTPAEAEIVARKTMAYEEGLLDGTRPNACTATFVNVGGFVDCRSLMDNWAAALPAGWKVNTRYYADNKRNDGTPPPNEKHVIDLLNEGQGLVVHAGHGHENGWAGSLSVKSLKQLRNADRLPVMISIGCSTAHFAPLAPYAAYVDVDGMSHKGTNHGEVFHSPPPPPAPYQKGSYNPSGLGEQMLRRGPQGAVAYIGCCTGAQGCALTLEEGFMKAIARRRNPRLGDCWTDAIVYYYRKEHLATLKPTESWYPPAIFFQGMKFMVFGDPSLQLPTPRERMTALLQRNK
jgi:hypothetical protein